MNKAVEKQLHSLNLYIFFNTQDNLVFYLSIGKLITNFIHLLIIIIILKISNAPCLSMMTLLAQKTITLLIHNDTRQPKVGPQITECNVFQYQKFMFKRTMPLSFCKRTLQLENLNSQLKTFEGAPVKPGLRVIPSLEFLSM